MLSWEEYLQQRFRACRTRWTYHYNVRRWIAWCAAKGIDWLEPPHGAVLDWIAEMRQQSLSPSTISQHTAALKAFADYLWDVRGVDAQRLRPPARAVPSGWDKLPRALTEEELERYLTAAAQYRREKKPAEPERTIMLIAPYAGLRASEWCEVLLSDLREHGQASDGTPLYVLRVRGKGRKERIVPILSGASATLGAYLQGIRPQLVRRVASPYLFPRPGSVKPLSTDQLWEAWSAVGKAAQIKDFRPHLCRSTYATALLELGLPIHEVARYLGHSGVQTTFEHYAAVQRGVSLGTIARPWRTS